MTHHEHDDEAQEQDDLQEEQEGKGYGEDEGQRDEALEQQNFETL